VPQPLKTHLSRRSVCAHALAAGVVSGLNAQRITPFFHAEQLHAHAAPRVAEVVNQLKGVYAMLPKSIWTR
jgi:hypothetical protein